MHEMVETRLFLQSSSPAVFRSFVISVSRSRIDIYFPSASRAALRSSPLSRNEHNWHRQDDLTCVLIIP